MATPPARQLAPPALATPWWQRGRPLSQAAWRQLVEQQCGLTLRAQAHDAGFTDQQILWRVRTGRWEAVAAGVYLTTVGRGDVGMWSVAAVLASAQIAPPTSPTRWAGLRFGGTVASQRGLPAGPGPSPTGRRSPRGPSAPSPTGSGDPIAPQSVPAAAAGPGRLALADCSRAHGVRPGRHDGVGHRDRRRRQAVATQRTTPASLRLALAGRARQRWRSDLIEVLTPTAAGAESVLELRFVKGVLRPHGLPWGRASNTRAGRHDRRYAALRLLVELDGWAWHGYPGARAHDNRRDRVAAIDGWLTTRAGWREVVGAPCQLAGELGRLMQARGWSGAPRRCRQDGCGATGLGSRTYTGLHN